MINIVTHFGSFPTYFAEIYTEVLNSLIGTVVNILIKFKTCEDYIFTDTLGYKYITDYINMLRIKLEDLLLFLVLMRLAPWISFYPSRILSLHPLRILGL